MANMKLPHGERVFVNAVIIDGNSEQPLEDGAILVRDGRIAAIGRRADLSIPASADEVDLQGRFVIPGLMNANVHLLMDFRLRTLALYHDRYDELIVEAAQVALKNGVTTVFDTWGPRRFLMMARDRIDAGAEQGSRIYCAGNIIGFDGPFSRDFSAVSADIAGARLTHRINAIWVENVGRHLMWLTAEEVAVQVRAYFQKGIDFAKYASNGHGGAFGSAFLALSERVQKVIVEEAHRAGLTAQAHSMTVEGLRIALEAGCDLITHCNMTGPTTIPDSVLDDFVQRGTGAVIFPFTQDRLDLIMRDGSEGDRTLWRASDRNARNLIDCGAKLLLATDGGIWPKDMESEPLLANRAHLRAGADNLFDLGGGHFAWLRAMEEKGCPPLKLLQAATRNIAEAYRKADQIGTLEVGKIADMVVLDANPFLSAANYGRIHLVVKEGEPVDRNSLPDNPRLTVEEDAAEEEASYIPFLSSDEQFPLCPLCAVH